MRIIKYKTEMDQDCAYTLVKEYACNYPSQSMSMPAEIADMVNKVFHLKKQTEEYIYMIAFNTKMRPVGIFEISHGNIDTSICSPREIFSKALLVGAAKIAIIHNHPSMDVMPSLSDHQVYETLKKAGELLDVPLVDSIIIGDGYFSFYEMEHQ